MIVFRAGFKGGGANWAVAPKLRALHKTVKKYYYLRKHKDTFTKYKSKYRYT